MTRKTTKLGAKKPEGEKPKPKNGRPSAFTQDLADEICRRLMQGETLVAICKGEDMVSETTVYNWLADKSKADFLESYTRARVVQADQWHDELIEVAKDGSRDTKEVDGKTVVDHEIVARSRLYVDTLKWSIARRAPNKYGDRVTQVHEAGDGLKELFAAIDGRTRGLPSGG